MHYEEGGIDLCGQTLIDKEGNCSYQDYGFAEGKYRLEGYVDWYMEWESHLCEYLAEHMKDEGDTYLDKARQQAIDSLRNLPGNNLRPPLYLIPILVATVEFERLLTCLGQRVAFETIRIGDVMGNNGGECFIVHGPNTNTC